MIDIETECYVSEAAVKDPGGWRCPEELSIRVSYIQSNQIDTYKLATMCQAMRWVISPFIDAETKFGGHKC